MSKRIKRLMKKTKSKWLILTIILLSAGFVCICFSAYGAITGLAKESNIDGFSVQGGVGTMVAVGAPSADQLPHQEFIEILNDGNYAYATIANPHNLPGQTIGTIGTEIYGYAVKIMKHGAPTNNLQIGLMGGYFNSKWNDARQTSSYAGILTVSPASIPEADTYYWVGIYFDTPLHLLSDQWGVANISIVLLSNEPASATNYWALMLTGNNQYDGPSGTYDLWEWYDGWPYGHWDEAPSTYANLDANFVIWTDQGAGPGPSAPVITISVPSWEIALLGSGLFIAAIGSGIKYRMIFI